MKVLFGVFDWGLGHATRDIPLIEELLLRKHEVDIISTGRSLTVLKERFGKRCRFFDVPSVHPPYTETNYFVLKFSANIPRMVSTLQSARRYSKKIIEKGNYDRVISDCRYDVYDKRENSFLINHQLRFISPVMQSVVDMTVASLMKPYGKVIVPDFPGHQITGKLSMNRYFNGGVEFIGIISQLKKRDLKENIDYFISISGPEPQRTVLEERIISQVSDLKGKVIIALGKPESKAHVKKDNLEIFSFLDQRSQEKIMNKSKFIISRSGYTTIMEIIELNKKNVLFVPTPGQTEQEYLADFYEEKKYFHHVSQDDLDLKRDISLAKNSFKGYRKKWSTSQSIKNFIKCIKS